MPVITQVFQRNMSELVRKETLGGKDVLVAPVILIREGVWNGLLYTAEELQKSAPLWNGRDLPVFHPADLDGNHISVNDPAVIEAHSIGRVFKVNWDPALKALKGECWIDIERAKGMEKGKAVLAKLEANEMIEVSTGLFLDVVTNEGDFQGKAYKGVAVNYKPDHLAVLPGKKGACSVADGAGMPRVNQQEEPPMPNMLSRILESVKGALASRGLFGMLTVNKGDDSLDKRRNALREVLQVKYPSSGLGKRFVWVEDMREKTVIFGVDSEGQPTRLFQADYSVDADGVPSLGEGEPVEVKPEVQYRPVSNEAEPGAASEPKAKGDGGMDKKQVIEQLITNGAFGAEDKAFLEGLSEAQLTKLSKLAQATPAPASASAPITAKAAAPTPAVQTHVAAPAATPPAAPLKVLSADEFLQAAPPEIRTVLQSGLTLHKNQREQVLKALEANPRNQFSKEQLAGMDLDTLKRLAALAQTEVSFAANDPGDPPPTTTAPVVNAMPTWDWEKDKPAEPAAKK